jgi:hypothetical protein
VIATRELSAEKLASGASARIAICTRLRSVAIATLEFAPVSIAVRPSWLTATTGRRRSQGGVLILAPLMSRTVTFSPASLTIRSCMRKPASPGSAHPVTRRPDETSQMFTRSA